MAVDFEFKSKYNVDDLLSIMRILREPGRLSLGYGADS